MIKNFTDSNGRKVNGLILNKAFEEVADWYEQNAFAVRNSDDYAEHITEEQKDKIFKNDIEHAENVRKGNVTSFCVWQRVNTVLTGECIAFLPK